MRYSSDHKQQARENIAAAAARAFRRNGFAGVGVDALAKDAGVTSGAFYGHFKSKDAAFQQVALAGLRELAAAIAGLQAAHGDGWLEVFIDFYLGDRRLCDLAESCGLQSLTPDVMRAGEATRGAYGALLAEVVAVTAAGLTKLPPERREACAIALLALLSGGVTMARSVADPDQAAVFARALGAAARLLAGVGAASAG